MIFFWAFDTLFSHYIKGMVAIGSFVGEIAPFYTA